MNDEETWAVNDEEICASCGCTADSCECDHQDEIRDRDATILQLNDKLIKECGLSARLRDVLHLFVLLIDSGETVISTDAAKQLLAEYKKSRAK